MSNVKIAFVCNWGQSPSQLLETYKKQTPNNSGKWGNLEGVDDPKNADFIIAMGPTHIIDKSKVIQFRREPDFIEPWSPLYGAKEIFDYSDGKPHVSTWWIGQSYDQLNKGDYVKDKNTSIISSSKWNHRTNYVKSICDSNPNTFDYFGNINITNQKHFGYLNRNVKELALIPYEKSVAIENSSQRNYFTEKIIDCILCSTMPLYWGCPNISDYFPEGSYRSIDLENPSQINDLIEKPISKMEIESLKEAKDLILNEYNIWPTIQKIIN